MVSKRPVCRIISVGFMSSFAASIFVVKILSDLKLTAVVNQRFLLPCNTSINAPVRWCFHKSADAECDEVAFNDVIVEGHRSNYELHDTALFVKSAHADLGGTYMCIEENGQGDRHRINLTVTAQDIISTTLRPNASTVSEYDNISKKMHHDGNVSRQQADVSPGIIAIIVVASIAVLLSITAAGLFYANRARRRSKDCWERVQRLHKDMYKEREQAGYKSSDPFIQTIARERGLMKACATKAAQRIKSQKLKPDAIVGIDGSDSSGSVMFATTVSERIHLPLILVVKKDIEQATVNDIHFNARYDNKEMIMHIDNPDGISKAIHNVVIVDTELVSGSSMHAAVEELKKHNNNIETIACLVIGDATTDELRTSLGLPRIISLFLPSHATETTALTADRRPE